MVRKAATESRTVRAVHARKELKADSPAEAAQSAALLRKHGRAGLCSIYGRVANGTGPRDGTMRRMIWRALCRRFGDGIVISPGATFTHIETFEIGDGVFIGQGAFIQGRHDGHCIIGAHSWIGPQSYFDARDLEIGEYVGWGPGAKVLGSAHTGIPVDCPIIATDLEIKPVRIGDWTDIGVNAVIMPGVTVGKGSIVGAGSVVTKNVPTFTVVAGVPARHLRNRQARGSSKQ